MWNLTKVCWSTKCTNKRKNAKNRGIDCTLTKNQIKRLYENNGGVCDYTGLPLTLESGQPHQATIERINSESGYTPSNILLVSSYVNRLKAKYLEFKNSDGKHLITVEEKKILDKLCQTLYNPDCMRALGEKYGWTSNTHIKELNEQKEPTPMTTEKKAPSCYDYNKTVNKELAVAKLFAGFGAFVEQKCDSEFNLTFSQFKMLITRKRCMLTLRDLPEDLFARGFWVKDKTRPVDKDNLLITTKELQKSLDNMCVNANLDITTLKLLGKALIK